MMALEEIQHADRTAICSCVSPVQYKPILIIDDSQEVCQVLTMFIQQIGFFKTQVVMSMEEAQAAFVPGKFFAIILDLNLGNSIEEGMDLATRFRDQDDNVYIAVMSGYEPPFDQRLLGSIDDFLQKPVDYKLLQRKLMMWSIQANRRLALKQYFDEKMLGYLNQLSKICEEQQQIDAQIEEIADLIHSVGDLDG